jgi:transcription elongation factor GreA
MASRSGLPGADEVRLADELVERARPHALGERRLVIDGRARVTVVGPRGARCSRRSIAPRVLQLPAEPMKERILKRFDDEIAVLERELYSELPKEIQRAREFGDLRENAEYSAAKERQSFVQARIAMLQRRRNEVALMNLDRVPHGKTGFGSTVTLREQGGGEIIYQLVMPEDADAEKGLISTASPIGRALLNKAEGDEVTVTTPAGTREFDVVKVVTIHDE